MGSLSSVKTFNRESQTPGIGCVLDLAGRPGDGSTILDNSPYGNNGTITGATWVKSPGGLSVLSFDGTDDLIAANGVAANGFFGGESTTIAWAKLTDWSVDRGIFTAGRTDATHSYIFIGYGFATGLITARSKTPAPAENTVPSLAAYNNDSTYHLFSLGINALGHIVDYSINGVTQGTSATADHDHSIEDTFYIGQLAWDAPNTVVWQGEIGLVRVYNRILSASEIVSIYNRERSLFGV